MWGVSRGSRTKHRGFSKLKLALGNFKTIDSAKKKLHPWEYVTICERFGGLNISKNLPHVKF